MIKRGRFEIFETLTEPMLKPSEKTVSVQKGRFEILIEPIQPLSKPLIKLNPLPKKQGRFEIIDIEIIEIEIINDMDIEYPVIYPRIPRVQRGRFEIIDLDA